MFSPIPTTHTHTYPWSKERHSEDEYPQILLAVKRTWQNQWTSGWLFKIFDLHHIAHLNTISFVSMNLALVVLQFDFLFWCESWETKEAETWISLYAYSTSKHDSALRNHRGNMIQILVFGKLCWIMLVFVLAARKLKWTFCSLFSILVGTLVNITEF